MMWWFNKGSSPKTWVVHGALNQGSDIVCEIIFLVIIYIKRFVVFLLAVTRGLLRRREVGRKPEPHLARQILPKDFDLWGMDAHKNRAHDFLQSERPRDSVLGFWGPSGVGKRTLLHCIFQSYRLYDGGCAPFRQACVLISGSTVAELQFCVAVVSGLDWSAMASLDERSRARIISAHLGGKPCLFLLHDVRDWVNLAAVGLPLDGRRLQKVIFTTRSEAMCVRMAASHGADAVDKVIEMRTLGEDDAWGLFTQHGVMREFIIDAYPFHDMARGGGGVWRLA